MAQNCSKSGKPETAIPSQARNYFRKGVETRGEAPKPRMGNGEGIVQATNSFNGAVKAEVVRKSADPYQVVGGQVPPPAPNFALEPKMEPSWHVFGPEPARFGPEPGQILLTEKIVVPTA
jgi:hypothetical protein